MAEEVRETKGAQEFRAQLLAAKLESVLGAWLMSVRPRPELDGKRPEAEVRSDAWYRDTLDRLWKEAEDLLATSPRQLHREIQDLKPEGEGQVASSRKVLYTRVLIEALELFKGRGRLRAYRDKPPGW